MMKTVAMFSLLTLLVLWAPVDVSAQGNPMTAFWSSDLYDKAAAAGGLRPGYEQYIPPLWAFSDSKFYGQAAQNTSVPKEGAFPYLKYDLDNLAIWDSMTIDPATGKPCRFGAQQTYCYKQVLCPVLRTAGFKSPAGPFGWPASFFNPSAWPADARVLYACDHPGSAMNALRKAPKAQQIVTGGHPAIREFVFGK